MTHASRPLQNYDLSGEGTSYGSHVHVFITTQGHGDVRSAQCRGHLRDNTNMKDDTQHSRTHSFEQSEYERMIMTAK